MKKILSLLFISSSLFSMELDIVRFDKKAAAIKSISKKMIIEPKSMRTKSKSMRIEPKSVFVPNRLGSIELSHGKKGFMVHKNDKKHVIQKYFIDKTVRNMTKDELKQFLKVGYLSLNQMDNGEFSLKANGRINGGGPLLGTAMYWITKSLCYGVAGAAIGTVTVATGGAVGAAVGTVVGGAAAGGTVVAGTVAAVNVAGAGVGLVAASTIAAPAAIATTVGVLTTTAATAGTVAGAGATLATAAIASSTAASTAAVLTTAAGVSVAASSGAAASVGTAAACVIGIETLSTAVGTFFGMMPTP